MTITRRFFSEDGKERVRDGKQKYNSYRDLTKHNKGRDLELRNIDKNIKR
jgi:hypothetical protein